MIGEYLISIINDPLRFMADSLIYWIVIFAVILAIIELAKSKKGERLKKVIFVILAFATTFGIGQIAHQMPTGDMRPYEAINAERGYEKTDYEISHSMSYGTLFVIATCNNEEAYEKGCDIVFPLVPHSDDSHFPSDHALLAFALAFMILFMTRFRKLAYVMLALAVAVVAGRLLALVHWPLDVIAGAAIAAIGAIWYLIYHRYFRSKPSKKVAE